MDKSHNLITSITSVAFCFIVLLVGTMSRGVKAQDTNPPSMNSPNAAQAQSVTQNGVVLLDKKVGFPIVINQPGSFSLKSNLTVPANTNGIVIAADNVTLDLNGFSITGSGSGDGITDNGVSHLAIAIRNGTITNFNNGINLGSSSQSYIEQIRALNNAKSGIFIQTHSIISRNIASSNGIGGITTGSFNTISKNDTSNNNGDGISTVIGSMIIDNNSNNNFNIGIAVAGQDCNISGNTADSNAVGISVTCPANLVGNTALDNTKENISLAGSGCTRANNNPAP